MQNSCLGKLLVDGNFQVIVPDSFAFMEHALGKKVEGIIKPGHFYSNYWNLKEINKIDCIKNKLYWGVALCTDKELKNNLKCNKMLTIALIAKKKACILHSKERKNNTLVLFYLA